MRKPINPAPTGELTLGSLVYLKSGSPRMAIERIEDGLIHVVWMSYGTSDVLRASFHPIVLEKARTP